jgi:hypothetical protein
MCVLAITWYFKGKLIAEDERHIMAMDEFTASIKILDVTLADYGPYVCRATIGEAFAESRGKLVSSSTAQTVYVVEETVPEVETASLTFRKILGPKKVKTKSKQSNKEEFVSEHLIQSESHTSSSKQTEQVITETIIEHVTKFQEIHGSSSTQTSIKIKTEDEVIVQEIQADDSIKELQHKMVSNTFDISNIDQLKYSSEVNMILEKIKVARFGQGEASLRELATIAYLVQNGMSEADIMNLYHSDHFPALQGPISQSAFVQLLEREGHATLVSEVLTESTDIDETTVASQAGFRAFMRMIQMKLTRIEEIITQFTPDDFVMQDWKIDESGEV